MIAVILPENYVPIAMNFGETVNIPIGQGNANSEGYFEILYNSMQKQCTIVFTTTSRTCFNFTCVGCYKDGEFPSSLNNYSGGTLEATIKSIESNECEITIDELYYFKVYFKSETDFSKLVKDFNEIKELIKTNEMRIGDEKNLVVTLLHVSKI